MYKISDVVEMGHNPLIGGSIEISIEFNRILGKEEADKYLTIIDYLDHCLVTDNEQITEFSYRFFLLDNSLSIFEDVHSVLYYFLQQPLNCTVKIGKESYTDILKPHSKILKYNYKG